MELPTIEIGVYMRCQFRTCNGVCERMCLKNKKIPHCFQHTNRKSLGKCANPECENGTNSSTGYCNKKCLGVTQQALTLRNSRLLIAHKNTDYECNLCRCTVKCRYTHELGKKHKYRSMMVYPTVKDGKDEKDEKDVKDEKDETDTYETVNRLDILPIREKMIKQLLLDKSYSQVSCEYRYQYNI